MAAALCLTLPSLEHFPQRPHLPTHRTPPVFPPQTAGTVRAPEAIEQGDSDNQWGAPDPAKFAAGAAQDKEARAAQAVALGYDLAGVDEALQAYAEGQGPAGDAVLASKDPTVRAAVEWT